MTDTNHRFLRRLIAGGLILWFAVAALELTVARSPPLSLHIALRLAMGLAVAMMTFGFFRLFAHRMAHSTELPVPLRKPFAQFFRVASVVLALVAAIMPVVPLLMKSAAPPVKGLPQ